MNLLDLPRDIIVEIGSYVVCNEDIFSFSFTCKILQSIAFVPERSLEFIEKTPFYIRNYFLSQDLSRLRKFSYVHDSPNQFMHDMTTLSILSTLYNLKHLELQFTYAEQTSTLADVVSKMTWLEQLRCCYPMPSDIGDYLADHTRLTFLGNSIEGPTLGYGKLTQLKHLEVAPFEDDSLILELLKLTNLTCLDFVWNQTISNSIHHITKLTKLEILNVSGLATELDWAIIATMPNLKHFSAELVAFTQEYVDVLPQFSRLTNLDLLAQTLPQSPEVFFSLTDLRELTYFDALPSSANFAPLVNITNLLFNVSAKIEQISLPPKLKEIAIYHIPTYWPSADSFFDGLCNATTLEKLELFSSRADILFPSGISRLCNLRSLKFNFRLTEDLCNNLKHMPYLRKMTLTSRFYRIEDFVVGTLKELDQLVELWVSCPDTILPELRNSLPFAVYMNDN